MPYTLYFLEVGQERVAHLAHIGAIDDNEAIKAASAWPWEGALEIWQGKGRVNRLEPDDGPMAA